MAGLPFQHLATSASDATRRSRILQTSSSTHECELLRKEQTISTLPAMPLDAMVPTSLTSNQSGLKHISATSLARHHLQGRCLFLLGDSTTTETAHDLAMLLHRMSPMEQMQYRVSATHMPSKATRHTSNNTFELSVGKAATIYFASDHRKMWFREPVSDAVVVHRFIGHADLGKNLMGIPTLNCISVRHELAALMKEHCGSRPRIVWLQSGYHDFEPELQTVNLSVAYKEQFNSALSWVETLAPHRIWLSRHSIAKNNVSNLEAWVQEHLLSRRACWAYADHREAWACSNDAIDRFVPMHTGAIKQGYHNNSYCCSFLSSLRTWLAIKQTKHVVERCAHVQREGPSAETPAVWHSRWLSNSCNAAMQHAMARQRYNPNATQ